jgi:hypothetical protein
MYLSDETPPASGPLLPDWGQTENRHPSSPVGSLHPHGSTANHSGLSIQFDEKRQWIPHYRTPWHALLKSDMELWGPIIKAANIKAD